MAPRSFHFPSSSHQIAPSNNSVKVNVDAHVTCGGGVRFGVIIRDNWWTAPGCCCEEYWVKLASDMAEAGAARYGVELARRLGYAVCACSSGV